MLVISMASMVVLVSPGKFNEGLPNSLWMMWMTRPYMVKPGTVTRAAGGSGSGIINDTSAFFYAPLDPDFTTYSKVTDRRRKI